MNKINEENFTCEKLRAYHMSQDTGVEFSREKFNKIMLAFSKYCI